MKKNIRNILSALCAVFLIWIMLVTSIEIICYHVPGFFEREYEKYDVLSDLPEMTMSEEDGLMAVTNHMMKYLRGDKDTPELQIVVKMDGEMRGFFTEREILHMEDVRKLFTGAQKLRIWAFVLTAVCLLSVWMLEDQGRAKTRRYTEDICKGLLRGSGSFLAVAAVLGIIIATNFSDAFITFHHIFFDNDLWILDPAVDMLVNIVPEGFFFDTASFILIVFSIGLGIMVFAAWFLLRSIRSKKNNSSVIK